MAERMGTPLACEQISERSRRTMTAPITKIERIRRPLSGLTASLIALRAALVAEFAVLVA